MTDQPLSRREARARERGQLQPPTADAGELASNTSESIVFELQDEVSHVTSQIELLEPKSLVMETAPPDLTNLNLVLPDSGAVLTTGSIELPWLKEQHQTNVIVTAGVIADTEALNSVTESTVTGINPIPARRFEKTRRRNSVFPNRLRKGWGIVHMVMLSGFVLLALSLGMLATFMLGIIKF